MPAFPIDESTGRPVPVEYILCAAIHFDDGKEHVHQPANITTGYITAGWRHANCYSTFVALGIFRPRWRTLWLRPCYPWRWHKRNRQTQGFITSKNRFIDRREAAQLAYARGQIKWTDDRITIYSLVSEDLY